MNVTTKLVLRESKQRADGRAPIYLRITANRKSRYKSTGIKIKPRYWNADRQQVRKSHDLYAAYNNRLRELRIEAEEAALSTGSAEAIKNQLDGNKGSLTNYFESFIESKRSKGEYWQRKKYRTTLNKLQSALGKEAIDWSEYDRGTLEAVERYCRDELDNATNTVRKELQRLRTFTRQAVKDGVIEVGDDPFHAYDLPQREKPNRRRLTLEEMRALESVDLPEGSDEAVARDVFLFAFYAAGARFGDVATLRRDNVQDGRLIYRMMKTGNPVNVPLPPPARRIVERYADNPGDFLFPLLERDPNDPVEVRQQIASALTMSNRSIKAVAKAAEIDRPNEVSSHVARHSYADVARQKSDNLFAISKSLGHSSIEQTESYLNDFDKEATDALAEQVWGGQDDE